MKKDGDVFKNYSYISLSMKMKMTQYNLVHAQSKKKVTNWKFAKIDVEQA